MTEELTSEKKEEAMQRLKELVLDHLGIPRSKQSAHIQTLQDELLPAFMDLERARMQQLRHHTLAFSALTDKQINLPILNPNLRLEEVLEHRYKNADALGLACDKLGWMARELTTEPWTQDFEAELYHKTIPDIAEHLDEVRKTRNDWLSERKRMDLTAAGIGLAAASVVLSIIAAPVTPLPSPPPAWDWFPARSSRAPRGCSTGKREKNQCKRTDYIIC
jgi:hypothetical protein